MNEILRIFNPSFWKGYDSIEIELKYQRILNRSKGTIRVSNLNRLGFHYRLQIGKNRLSFAPYKAKDFYGFNRIRKGLLKYANPNC